MLLRYPNITITGFQTTIGAYNVFALPEYVNFVRELWATTQLKISAKTPQIPFVMSTVILNPEATAPKQLPEAYKQRCVDKLSQAQAHVPEWAQELLNTAIYSVQQPSTRTWEVALHRLNAYPTWRGSTDTWDTMWNQYMI